MSARARIGAAAALGLAMAVLLVASDREALVMAVVPALARDELADLDRLAGLRDANGVSAVAEPVAVAIAVEGPAWLNAEVREAVASDDVYVVREGPHRILGELVVTPPVVALRLSLDRRGWVLHGTPVRRRLQPELAIVPALVGVAAWAWSRRLALAIALAGLLAQLGLALAPWPAELAAPAWTADVVSGPFGARVVALARGMDDTAVAIAAGVVALGLVLAWFDHRRRAQMGGVSVGSAVLALVGAIAWIEAAGRTSVGAWITTGAGLVALVLAFALVGLVHAHHRRRGAPVRAAP